MTAPAQPEPYPGDVPAEKTHIERRYADIFGIPYEGEVRVSLPNHPPFTVPLVGGTARIPIVPGAKAYNLTAILSHEGRITYLSETVSS